MPARDPAVYLPGDEVVTFGVACNNMYFVKIGKVMPFGQQELK